jgi:ankyrin repeat protein
MLRCFSCRFICALVDSDAEVDVNAADDRGWTPLMLAVRRGYDDVVKALVCHKGIDLKRLTNTGHSAIELSKFYRQKEVYDLLAKAGVSVDIHSKNNLIEHWLSFSCFTLRPVSSLLYFVFRPSSKEGRTIPEAELISVLRLLFVLFRMHEQ